MSQKKSSYIARAIVGVFLIMIAIMCCVGSVVMLGFTFVAWWVPLAIALPIAAISGLTLQRIWKWLTGTDTFAWNYICHVIFFTSLFTAGLLTVNYCVSTSAPSRHEKAVITKIYKEKRYQTKRVSRRVYTRGAPYYVYNADITLKNGRTTTISISKKRYDELHRGDTLGVVLRDGFFGWEELRTDSITYPKPHKKKRRHFGPRSRRPSAPGDTAPSL